jgi:hypothetical protein
MNDLDSVFSCASDGLNTFHSSGERHYVSFCLAIYLVKLERNSEAMETVE